LTTAKKDMVILYISLPYTLWAGSNGAVLESCQFLQKPNKNFTNFAFWLKKCEFVFDAIDKMSLGMAFSPSYIHQLNDRAEN